MIINMRFAKPSPLGLLTVTIVVILTISSYIVHMTNNAQSAIELHNTNLHSTLDSLDSDEYRSSIVDELSTSKNSEILKNLRIKIEHDQKKALLQQLKDEIAKNSVPELLDQLRERISVENEKEVVENIKNGLISENRQQIVQDAKDHYIETHVDKFDASLVSLVSKKHQTEEVYFKQLFELLLKFKPKSAKLTGDERGGDLGGHSQVNVPGKKFTIEYLTKDRVNLPKEKFEDLQSNHRGLVAELLKLEFPDNIFKGRGIVINGGGIYFGAALIAIRQLREVGSQLPIELVVDSEAEYDEEICEVVLPKLNSRCRVIERVLGKELHKALNLRKFELKAMGLLVSTFEDIILLDADNMAIKSPDYILESDLYNKYKFILWPDLWHKATSPLYYDIAGISLGEPVRRGQLANDKPMMERKDTALHDLEGATSDQTSETGQMAFSKRDHYRSFLLATYYNMNGYSHYYRLIFQGTFGEGDKETFAPAMEVFKEPYYLLEYKCFLAGFDREENRFSETVIVQHDPVEGDKYMEAWKSWLISQDLDARLNPFQKNDYTSKLYKRFREETKTKKPSVQFLHCHNPKPNPFRNVDERDTYGRRSLGKIGKYAEYWDRDWELKIHSISKWVVCDAISKDSPLWKKFKKNRDKVCKRVSEYVEFLKKDSNNLSDGDLLPI